MTDGILTRTERISLARDNSILLLSHPNGTCSFGYYAKWEGGSCSGLPLLTDRFTKPSRKEATTAAYEWIRKTVDRAPKDLKEEIGKNFLAHISTRREDKLIIKSVV